MEISFIRTILKKAIDNCKNVSDNKQSAKVWFFSFTETDLFLYTQRDKKGFKYFHHLKTTEPLERQVSFIANPYDLDNFLKGKEKEKTWFLEEEGILKDNNDNQLQITQYQGKFPIEKLPYIPMDDSEEFKNLLDEIIKASSKEVDLVEIGGYEATIKSPIFIKRFTLNEDFPKFIFPIDYISQLKKNIIWNKGNENRFSFCSKNNELYLRLECSNSKKPDESFRILFVLKQSETYSPRAKQLEEEVVHTFKINTENFWELVKKYPASITDIYLYDDNGELVIDPYDKQGEELEENEDQPIFRISYEGNLKRTKIDRVGLLSLLCSYEGTKEIDIIKYIENDEETFAFRIYDRHLYSIVATKKEPNYSKIQRKLDKFLDYEKSLTFLNE